MERTLYAYTYVRQPFDEVARLLAEDPDAFLQEATDRAAEHAREFESELRIALGRFDVGREIRIEVGEFRPSAMQAVSLPLSWTAAEHRGLFPSMQAILELQAVSLRMPLTQIALIGTYRPPLGVVGAAGDALVGKRVAEAALHHFVTDIAQRVEQRMRDYDAVPLG